MSEAGADLQLALSSRRVFVVGQLALLALLVFFAVAVPLAWAEISREWVAAMFAVLAVVAVTPFKVQVSGRERFYAFSASVAVLGVVQSNTTLLAALTIWTVGELVGVAVTERSVWVAALVAAPGVIVGAGALLAGRWVFELGAPAAVSAIVFVSAYLGIGLVVHGVVPVTLLGTPVRDLARSILLRPLLRVLAMNTAVMLVAVYAARSIDALLPAAGQSFGTAVVLGVSGATFFALAMMMRARSAGERLGAVLTAARALPWPDEVDPVRQTVEYVRQAVSADRVEVRTAPPRGANQIGAPIRSRAGDELYVVAQRRAGRAPFLKQDEDTLAAIAHMGTATLRIRDQTLDLEAQANTDSLTKLPNYRAFQMALARANASRSPGGAIAVVYIDLDNFKAINDAHGHDVGNLVLRTFADRLRRVVRPSDTVARVGGDEFVIILTDVTSRQHADAVADRISRAISGPIPFRETILALNVTPGVAYSDHQHADPDELVQEADQRMYSARGRSLRSLADHDDLAASAETDSDVDVTDLVGAAIEGDGLAVFYQPVVDNVDDRIIKLEALVRMRGALPRPVPAEVLVHEARRLGLLDALTAIVIERGLDDMERLRRVAPDLHGLSVNIEVDQVLDPEFQHMVRSATRAHPEIELHLEMTEASLNRHSAEVLTALHELKREGVMLALDDFGQAYSTFLSVVQYPFDTLKVDRALIRDLGDTKTQQVIRSLALLARKLDIMLVVEGVETQEQREQLRRLGVRYMQGFLFGRPMPAEDLTSRLAQFGEVALLPG